MEESVELSHITHPESEELLTINFGPHHPATHGVLRLIATLEAEVVTRRQAGHRLRPHRDREDRRGQGVLEGHPRHRADGLPRVLLQRDGVLRGGRDDPRPRGPAARAVPARDPHGAQPDHVPPGLARHDRARPRRDLDVLVLLPRPRADRRPVRDVVRPAHAHALLPGRRRHRGHPGRLGAEGPHVHQDHAGARRPVPRDPDEERDRAAAAARRRAARRGDAARARRHRPAAARRRQPVGPAQGRAVLAPTTTSTSRSRSAPPATTGTA